MVAITLKSDEGLQSISTDSNSSVQEIKEGYTTTAMLQHIPISGIRSVSFSISIFVFTSRPYKCSIITEDKFTNVSVGPSANVMRVTLTRECGILSYTHPHMEVYMLKFATLVQPRYHFKGYYSVFLNLSDACLRHSIRSYLTLVLAKRSVSIELNKEIYFDIDTLIVLQKIARENCTVDMQYRFMYQVVARVKSAVQCEPHEVKV